MMCICVLGVVILAMIKADQNCGQSMFPYIYGGFTVDLNSTEDAYNFPFCAVSSASFNRMRMMDGGDLLMLYFVEIVNPPTEYLTYNFNKSSVLVRTNMNENPGMVEWAKSFYIIQNGYTFSIQEVAVTVDVIWTIFATYHNSIFQGAILKLDYDGNVVTSFGILESLDSEIQVQYYFKPSRLIIFEDSSFLITADTYFYKTLGVSENSSMDQSIFMFDSNREIKWILSIDFNNKFDAYIGLKEMNNNLYGVQLNDYENYCLFYLTTLSGALINSNCYIRDNYITKGKLKSQYNLMKIPI